MYVCVCNAVTDSDIRKAVEGGVRNLRQLKQTTQCGTRCGSCTEMSTQVLQQALSEKRTSEDFLPNLQPA